MNCAGMGGPDIGGPDMGAPDMGKSDKWGDVGSGKDVGGAPSTGPGWLY